jgi:hypothetical protein
MGHRLLQHVLMEAVDTNQTTFLPIMNYIFDNILVAQETINWAQ